MQLVRIAPNPSKSFIPLQYTSRFCPRFVRTFYDKIVWCWLVQVYKRHFRILEKHFDLGRFNRRVFDQDPNHFGHQPQCVAHSNQIRHLCRPLVVSGSYYVNDGHVVIVLVKIERIGDWKRNVGEFVKVGVK